MMTLFTALVDDAGLFPPTSLHMSEALARHRRDQESAETILTHRFLCPVGRLDALRRESFVPRRLGLIVEPGEEIPSFDDLPVDFVEIRLPEGESIPQLVARLRLPWGVRLFVEVPPQAAAMEVPDGAGLKVRCGGSSADRFPPVEHLAAFIRSCVSRGVPFKATAGLHHAVRHFDPALGVDRHGFLNLVVAVCEAVDERDPVPALRMTDVGHLVRLAREVSRDTAERARQLLVSYGSCCTNTPVEGLRTLGLIEEAS